MRLASCIFLYPPTHTIKIALLLIPSCCYYHVCGVCVSLLIYTSTVGHYRRKKEVVIWKTEIDVTSVVELVPSSTMIFVIT